MKSYQLTYLLSPDLSEEELKSIEEKITSLIQKEGSIINEVNLPQKKDLAYPIKKKKTAYFCNLNFNFPSEKLANLEKNLKSEKKILRYLIESKKLLKKAPAILVKRRRKIVKPKVEKVELKEIEKKLEEILKE